jgi:riboflavin synthase
MFTGIVTDVGILHRREDRGDTRLRIATGYDTSGIDIGASIACDGVCLTAVALGEGWFEVDASAETLAKTTIGGHDGRPGWQPGRRINLERALKVGDELGGHIVSGHVDGLARVVSITPEGDSLRYVFEVPPGLAGYVAPKGSVALNGTSLTVNHVDGVRFGVNLIPHTRAVTTWGDTATGDLINFEVDTLARYVARLREWGNA